MFDHLAKACLIPGTDTTFLSLRSSGEAGRRLPRAARAWHFLVRILPRLQAVPNEICYGSPP